MSLGALRWSRVATLALAILAVLPVTAETSAREWQFPPALLASSLEARKSDPLAFAAAVPLRLGVEAGEWRSLPSGQALWQLHLNSPGARSLSLLIDAKQLPQSAILHWRAEPGGDVQGPFKAPFPPQLWLPLVRGDRAVLEVRLPERNRGQLQLQVVEGFHGFRGPGPQSRSKGGFGQDEGCHLNAACADHDDLRSEIRSTVLLTLNNTALCTGTLLNNSREDGRPLLLTAKHCFGESRQMDGVRAYFNIEQSCCPDAPPPQATQFLQARTLLLTDDVTDFALLELERSPPKTFHAYFSGWDARPEAVPRSGFSIHHPAGDDKRISFFNTPARRVDAQEVGGSIVADTWEVLWSRGTTEPGSSGSGLWNQDRNIVGQLAGGNASCKNLEGKDYYGRLERTWARQPELKNILAPTSDALVLQGMDTEAPTTRTCPAQGRKSSSAGGGAVEGTLVLFGLAALRRRRLAVA